jgi:hypothetical protein
VSDVKPAWMIEIDGYLPERFDATTAAKAKYRAYLQFCEAFGKRAFGDFLRRGVKARPVTSFDLAGEA